MTKRVEKFRERLSTFLLDELLPLGGRYDAALNFGAIIEIAEALDRQIACVCDGDRRTMANLLGCCGKFAAEAAEESADRARTFNAAPHVVRLS